MKVSNDELKKEILEAIDLCKSALNGNLNEIAHGSSEAQIRNVILPELTAILNAIEIDTIKEYKGKRLNSTWYVMDTWNNNSILGEKILSINDSLR